MRRALPFMVIPAVVVAALMLASDRDVRVGPCNYDHPPRAVGRPAV